MTNMVSRFHPSLPEIAWPTRLLTGFCTLATDASAALAKAFNQAV